MILSEPNLFVSYWGKKYLNLYTSSSPSSLSSFISPTSNEASQRWNLALTSILSISSPPTLSSNISYSSISSNFCQVVLENFDFLKNISPTLWTRLLLYSLNNDAQLLQAVYTCYNQQFLTAETLGDDEDDDNTNEDSDTNSKASTFTGLEFLEYQIKICQSKIGNSSLKKNDISEKSKTSLPINILECMVQSSFLRVTLDILTSSSSTTTLTTTTSASASATTTITASTSTTEISLIEAQHNLLTIISNILSCTPPGRLFEDVIPSMSVSQTILRVFAFDSSSQRL